VNSVNTIVVSGPPSKKILTGYNTDMLGFKKAVEKAVVESHITSAIIYGYGGVTLTCVAALRELGIQHLYLNGRRRGEATKRAEELGIKVWDGESCDLFINAAPVSSSPLELAENFLPTLEQCKCKVVFDHELVGSYLKDYCIEQQIAHISGEKMYIPQMIAQWSLFLSTYGIDEAKLPELIRKAEEFI